MENLDLIDWRMVGFTTLWIVGLAIELSVLGFVDYHAKERGERRRNLLRQPGYQIWINVGLVLFCLGVLGLSRALWESVIWGVLVIAFAYYPFQAYKSNLEES
jgi:multisubunit Na+/H+ antiporter MnhB subunit